MMRIALILLAVGACATQDAITPGETFDLAYGRSARLTSGDVTLRFEEVTAESRCPRGVNCVWEGDAAIRLSLSVDGRPDSVVLHTNGRNDLPRAATVPGYTIELVELKPYPESPEPVPHGSYVATLRLTRT